MLNKILQKDEELAASLQQKMNKLMALSKQKNNQAISTFETEYIR